jgi:hypothetical protein
MATSSLFDPEFLLNQEVQGEMSTKAELIPLGRYDWQIKDVKVEKVEPKDTTKDAFFTLEVVCELGDSAQAADGRAVKEITGREVNQARIKGYLDVTEAGSLDLGKGRNVLLGQLRAATNLNNPSISFKLPMLKGQVFSGEVVYKASKDPDRPFTEIVRPLPAGAK